MARNIIVLLWTIETPDHGRFFKLWSPLSNFLNHLQHVLRERTSEPMNFLELVMSLSGSMAEEMVVKKNSRRECLGLL